MFIFLITFLQIVLESLPISSSGHLLLAQRMASLELATPMLFLLNGPTLIMFAFYFYNRWSLFIRHPWRMRFVFLRMLGIGFIADAAGLGGWALAAFINSSENIFFHSCVLSIGFMITGVALYSLRFVPQQEYKPISWQRALLIGAMQGLAVWPGVSRLGITLVTGRWLGLAPRSCFLFSCMLQASTLLVSAGYGAWVMYPAIAQWSWNVTIFCYLIMVVIAMVIAYYLLWWVERQFEAGRLWRFAYYMIVPAVVALFV